MRIREKRRRANSLAIFFLVMLAVSAVCACGLIGFTQISEARRMLGAPASDLNPFENLFFTAYLTLRVDDLKKPAGDDATPKTFTVASGEAAGAIAERLAREKLVADGLLLNFYLRYTGADQHIEAGDFVLRQTMTVSEIALALTDARAREGVVRIIEGWRLEQIGESLSRNPTLDVTAEEFLALVGPNGPRSTAYSFMGEIPAGASLEGFLFPDTYLVRPGATAGDLVNRMLANFDSKMTPGYRASLAARGLTLYQAVIIAALIEREAMLDDERPIIASVILNRLAADQPLEIDATVQYVLGAPGQWWPPVVGLDLRSIASPYNTYFVNGLPAGPIANPSLKSLQAVANAAQTDYYFYRALCDGSGRHAFAATYDEHLQNACP
jgi:UPF0755 protein